MVTLSIMCSNVSSLGCAAELLLQKDRSICLCFEDDDSAPKPGVTLLYVNIVTAKCSQCNCKSGDH